VDDNSGGAVLVIGSGRQLYREYLLEGASRRRPLWLIDEQPPTWQRPYIVGSAVVEPLDPVREIPDRQGLLDAATAAARAYGVRGIFTYDELLVTATADIADRLGLPGLTASGAEHCRNKPASRQALTAAGLPQPRFALAYTEAEASAAAAGIGYPVVVKPRGMAASVGVVRADGPADLPAAFAVAERASRSGAVAYEGGVLIEELIDGPEISVDGAVVAGEYFPFCLARKQVGLAPYFEETGHLIDGDDPLLDDADLLAVLGDAHRALGVAYGITHSEVRLASRGLVVIEVNARLGGDMIPYLGKLATGVDPGRIAVEVALGARPVLEPERGRCAGIRFLYPPENCRVVEIAVPEPGAVPGLVAAHRMVAPGALVRLPPHAHIGRYACLIAVTGDPVTCSAALADAAEQVRLKYEALEESELAGERPW
jgi:biotin carboxylase